ncbi:MAG: Fpg/Nei family DNA glycosylase [Chloroflexi bacterium]|nr:Fpg/Nei family DNA glycosylase [Chloroflexota bacterium]MBV9546211.1 Fpg/Nei family DNA glycosylase [Chloroflexota bacterium]
MPELPDLTVYLDFLNSHIVGQTLEHVRVASPFVLRTADPPLSALEGKRVLGMRRMGKRLVFELEDDLFLVIHLMIAGRFRWKDKGAPITARIGLAAFDFSNGTLLLTEASPKKRAAIHVLRGEASLAEFNRGGLEPLDADVDEFRARLLASNHTLKRALTDPDLFSGIGNAYSDEILHRARMSPVKLTRTLEQGEVETLFEATQSVLREWIDRLRREANGGFPEKVTAFRKDMAVHGRYKQPCPVCGTPVQRIVHAENESNYCPTCQTGGKLLADRALSRLLKRDWPRTIEELEARRAARV